MSQLQHGFPSHTTHTWISNATRWSPDSKAKMSRVKSFENYIKQKKTSYAAFAVHLVPYSATNNAACSLSSQYIEITAYAFSGKLLPSTA